MSSFILFLSFQGWSETFVFLCRTEALQNIIFTWGFPTLSLWPEICVSLLVSSQISWRSSWRHRGCETHTNSADYVWRRQTVSLTRWTMSLFTLGWSETSVGVIFVPWRQPQWSRVLGHSTEVACKIHTMAIGTWNRK